jgi:Tol biopolymer transport system component
VTWENLNWKVIHSAHFDIHYPEGYEYLGERSVEIAEQANILLGEKLKHVLSEVIPIYIYPSHGYFQMTNIIPFSIDEGTGGVTESTRKRILVPYDGSYESLLHVLTHEIVHAFQFDILLRGGAGNVVGFSGDPQIPLWLIEGMAEYYSIGWNGSADMMIRDAVLTGTMPSIFELNNYQVVNPVMFYKGGQVFYQYIAQTWGEEKIPELLKDMRDVRDIKAAFKTCFGISLEDLNRNWMLWLKRLYFSDIGLKSGFEAGVQSTAHLYDKSIINLHPAISPDGKTVAYISVRNYNPVIIVRKISNMESGLNYKINIKEKSKEEIIVRAGQDEKFYQLHLLDNNITFLPDSKTIFFAARAYGKDVLYLFDIEKKKILKSWFPDVDMIQSPSLSSDAKFAVYSGSKKGQTDLYILNLENSIETRLTSDYFTEKDPVFSQDNKLIYFSGNLNDENNLNNRDYDLFQIDIISKEVKNILRLPMTQEKPQVIAGNSSELVFISEHEHTLNAYKLNFEIGEVKPVTNSFSGILSMKPDLSGSNFVAAVYQEQGYDVVVYQKKDIDSMSESENNLEQRSPEAKPFLLPLFPSQVSYLSDLKQSEYIPRFGIDSIFFGIAYSSYYGFGGFAFFSINEYMGDHRITGIVDFIALESRFNFNLDYYFLKYRLNWHLGLFRTTSYFSVLNLLDLTSLNSLIYDPNQFTSSLYRFGGFLKAEYPWTNFLRNSLGIEISRYEETFYPDDETDYLPIATNVFAASASLVYNNTIYSYSGPLKGTFFAINDRQTMNLTGTDHEYNGLSFDFRHYFNFFERYVFAIRAAAGVISGLDSDYYFWRLGGPFSMRGYDFLSLTGKYNFLVNLELRFPFIDYFVFGFPVQWIIRGFSAVVFMDFGSAFSNFEKFDGYDESGERLKDLKMSFGAGLRFILVPGILLRFDWATPWDLKSALPIEDWKFNFSLGYEY